MKTKIFKEKKFQGRVALAGLLLLPLLLRSCNERDLLLPSFDPDIFMAGPSDAVKTLLLLLLLLAVAAAGIVFLIGVLVRIGAKMGLQLAFLMLASLAAGAVLSSPALLHKLAPKPAVHHDDIPKYCDISCFDGGGPPAVSPAPTVPPPPAAPDAGSAAGA